MRWLSRHWKTIAVVAVSTVAFVAVAATVGLVAAPVVALLAAGFASGVVAYSLGRKLDHQKVVLRDALIQGALSAAITVATAGLGRVLTPVFSRVAGPLVARTLANTTAGATLGGGTAVVENALAKRPLMQGVERAALLSGAAGAVLTPLQRALGGRIPPREPLTHLTSAGGEEGILESGQIVGRKGIFAVPERVAGEGTLSKVLRTGLDAHKTTADVPIPGPAQAEFTPVRPIGPYSFLKWLGGVHYAPPGSIDVNTGAFTPRPAVLGPEGLVYGPDVLLLWGGAVSAGAARDRLEQPQSPGLTSALDKATK